MDDDTGLEMWGVNWGPFRTTAGINNTYTTTTTSTKTTTPTSTDLPPLVLIPGAGFGLTSFLPLALLLQLKMLIFSRTESNGYARRPILLFRLPWVEVCRPWQKMPQWSAIMDAIMKGFDKVYSTHNGESGGCELTSEMKRREMNIDVIAHSYGTAVANRLVREVCGKGLQTLHQFRHSQPMSSLNIVIKSLVLIDPIVLGGATSGLSGCYINRAGPDLSFTFCGNRAGGKDESRKRRRRGIEKTERLNWNGLLIIVTNSLP